MYYLHKKYSKEEVLEAMASIVVNQLPKHLQGKVDACFNDDGEVEIIFTEQMAKEELS